MSKEKLYVIKSRSDDNFYFSGNRMLPNWSDGSVSLFGSYEIAKEIAEDNNGQPATFVEEPEKVVLTKEQAKIVKYAHSSKSPASNIAFSGNNDEELLVNAYVNGYTVAKEKKYNVKVPHAEGWHFQKYSRESKRGSRNDWKPFPAKDIDSNMSKDLFLFAESEIEHYGLQDCEKEEVTDDEND